MENKSIFYKGNAGTGKTTAAIEYLLSMQNHANEGVLVLVPQKTIAAPYYEAIKEWEGIPPDILTISGFSTAMVELFWPVVADQVGFSHPERAPVFLNLESAQYFMARVMRPLLEEGAFSSVTITRNRLYTQVIDNLNKAALNGFPHEEIESRLSWAAPDDLERNQVFGDAQIAAKKFREYCLANNLLDFSLQIEIFSQILWQDNHVCREYLKNNYKHLIVENLEETTPIEQDIISDWLPDLDSALLVYDLDGGYRTFLGADAKSALHLQDKCDDLRLFTESYTQHPDLSVVENQMSSVILQSGYPAEIITQEKINQILGIEHHRFFPQMIHAVAENVASLINENGVPPNEIVVLSPFLSDALRFSLTESLNRLGVKTSSHRPSRPLKDEPVTHAMLTLAKLVYPDWGFVPSAYDVAYMLIQVIEGLDLVRAQLLTEIVYHPQVGEFSLSSFENIIPEAQSRITYDFGERYQKLHDGLHGYYKNPFPSLDIFFNHVFGEILSTVGFGFHHNPQSGIIIANLIDSIKNFRTISDIVSLEEDKPMGKEYIETVEEGVIAAQYIRSWSQTEEDSVFLLPATTYLMQNQPVEYQFWLDVGSPGWYERIFQPITQPFLLNKNWPSGLAWTDADEDKVTQESLDRLVKGLLRRCGQKVYLGISDFSESGYEMQGDLLKIINQVFQQIRLEGDDV